MPWRKIGVKAAANEVLADRGRLKARVMELERAAAQQTLRDAKEAARMAQRDAGHNLFDRHGVE